MNSIFFATSIGAFALIVLVATNIEATKREEIVKLEKQDFKNAGKSLENALQEAENWKMRAEIIKIKGEALYSSPDVRVVNSACIGDHYHDKQHLFGPLLSGGCAQCCSYESNSSFTMDEEKTKATMKCHCKKKEFLDNCKYKENKESCKLCCAKFSSLEVLFPFDEELSFKDGEGCVCQVKVLVKTDASV